MTSFLTHRHREMSLWVIVVIVQATSFRAYSQEAPQTTVEKSEWTVLFDGTHLDGWRGYKQEARPAGWVIEGDALVRKGGGGDLVTVEEFDDFELTFEWKVAEASNSGVMYRVRLGDNAPYMSGPEYQVLDEKHADAGNPLTHAASLYGIYPARPELCKPRGEWNSARIVVKDNHVEHWLNGEQIVQCEMWSDDWNQRFDKSKFKGWHQFGKSRKGHIALQDHGDPVWYRNIRIRRLGQNEKSSP